MKVVPILTVMTLLFGLADATMAEDLQPLRESLTLHAAFDDVLDANFSKGSKSCLVMEKGALVPAVFNNDVKIVADAGRFGNALHFTKKSSYRPLFPGKGILNYNEEKWSTTVSAWLRLNPDVDLEPGYCDPLQIVGNDLKKGFIFLEWSKDDSPRFFRYAIRPLFEIWNPNNIGWDQIPAENRPMVQVAKAPFSAEKWTHVVFTIENANSKARPQNGKLFINGNHMGTIENWDLTFGWPPETVQLVLGVAYVGYLDDLAVFNRALTEGEVKQLYQLKTGVRELYSDASSN